MIEEQRKQKLDTLELTLLLLSKSDPEEAEIIRAITVYLEPQRVQRRARSEAIKAGIARRKAMGGHVGRKQGSRDSRPRKTDGYWKRPS